MKSEPFHFQHRGKDCIGQDMTHWTEEEHAENLRCHGDGWEMSEIVLARTLMDRLRPTARRTALPSLRQ